MSRCQTVPSGRESWRAVPLNALTKKKRCHRCVPHAAAFLLGNGLEVDLPKEIRVYAEWPSHGNSDLPALFGPVITGEQRRLRGPAFSDHYAGESAAVVIARRAYSLGLSPLRAR